MKEPMCMPKTHHDDEREKVYNEICDIMNQEKRMNAIAMGNLDSVVGEGSTNKVIGPFGLGK